MNKIKPRSHYNTLNVQNIVYLTLVLLLGCGTQDKHPRSAGYSRLASDSLFGEYWYSGLAEVSYYTLSQSRYGESRKGKANLIFVTEPFSKSKQVKLDKPSVDNQDATTVLKLNYTKKFNTGIYPYSLMLSVFSPVETMEMPNPIKLTMTGQEWCGHVFSQLNSNENDYTIQNFSYFEKEGDEKLILKKQILEDEIWNRIRLNYTFLPIDTFTLIPSFYHIRLTHAPLKSIKVRGSLTELGDLLKYRIEHLDQSRIFEVTFDKKFPFIIRSWKESVLDNQGRTYATEAVLDTLINIDYWNKNQNSFNYLYDSLSRF